MAPGPGTRVDSETSFQGGGRILVVDDEELLREMVKAMLNRLGFEVLVAGDGMEAVDVFRQRQDEIRLVITDLTMPRMNGWETLSALREIKPAIPVILSSGYDEAQILAGDHAEQPQAFLHKPFQMKTLKKALEKVLKSGRTQGE